MKSTLTLIISSALPAAALSLERVRYRRGDGQHDVEIAGEGDEVLHRRSIVGRGHGDGFAEGIAVKRTRPVVTI